MDYRGAVLTFKKRYTNGWDLMASYTYSKTEGINPRPHDNGALGQGLPCFPATDSGSDPNDWYNAEHLQNGDRTHMFRVHVQRRHRLGPAGERRAQPPERPPVPAAGAGRRADHRRRRSRSRQTTARVSDCRARRSSTSGLQKTFKLGSDVTVDIGLQLLNVLNEDAEEYYSSVDALPGPGLRTVGLGQPEKVAVQAPTGVLKTPDGRRGAARSRAPSLQADASCEDREYAL